MDEKLKRALDMMGIPELARMKDWELLNLAGICNGIVLDRHKPK
jgi:hypothetical protein